MQQATASGGGSFHVPFRGKDLDLKLVRVHTEYLADLGGGVQFACVDLVGADGPVYDVDFFMKGLPDKATVTETTVHKIDGQPLYAWKQNPDNTWVRVPLDKAPDSLLGVLRGEDAFQFVYRVKIPTLAGPSRMWIPLATSDAYQKVKVTSVQAPGSRKEITEQKHGDKVMVLDL